MNPNSTIRTARSDSQSVLIPAVLRSRFAAARQVPLVAGLCVPKGRLHDVSHGRIDGFDSSVSAQFEVLNRWNDGSVRWMLTSFVAPEACGHGREVGVVTFTADALTAGRSVPFDRGSTRVVTVKCADREIVVALKDLGSDPPLERTLRLSPRVCDIHGEELALHFDGIREETVGAVRQVFVISARLQSMPAVTLQFRLTQWATAGLLQVETRIRNTRRARHAGGLWDLGDPGSFLFRSLEISTRSDEIPAGATTHWKAERDQVTRSTRSEVFLRQFGSGGRYWNSPNHMTAAETVAVQTRGYEAISDAGTLRGHRAEPSMLVEGDGCWMAVAVPEFWQQFPGSVAVAMGSVEVGLFPAFTGLTHELQGGEQKTQTFWLATGDGSGNLDCLDWVYDAPRLLQSPSSIAEAGVLPWFHRSSPCEMPELSHADQLSAEPTRIDRRFQQYLADATSGRFSIDARRAAIDEYGWRNFGDVPADHEQTHYPGANTVVSHYNNQFDMIFGAILQLISSGDLKWTDLFDPLARHVMDIDIYHTNADRAAFNGGLFWHTDHYVDARTSTHRTYSRHNQRPSQSYGGGPSCEHNYTTGLLHYHFLTGSPEARESVLSLADWVIRMDDGRDTVLGLVDDGPTGAASATVFEDFHGPGRGAGNSINALLDAWILTGSERYLTKLEELIRRCVHPSQNPDELHLLDAEGHWSYTVFLNSLGRYLLAKRDAELFDAMYSYARDVMKMYGRWMAANERRTLDHPEQLRYPTEAWAAQDFRKANVLRIAATCEDDNKHSAAMRTKADEINDAAWSDLALFGDAGLTARCLSILMTEGHREIFHRTREAMLIPSGSESYDVGSWSMFVPQKQRVKRLLKSPVSLLQASIQALRPSRILKTLNAVRRQL